MRKKTNSMPWISIVVALASAVGIYFLPAYHFLKNFPQFVVIHTVKGFSIVNEAEVDVFLDFSLLF